jgi:hypothetical protein
MNAKYKAFLFASLTLDAVILLTIPLNDVHLTGYLAICSSIFFAGAIHHA